MIITYYGKQFFKIQQGDTTVAINPVGKKSKIKAAKFGADIAVSSLNHVDFNGVEDMKYGDKVPFAITGPGEYERSGIFVKGFGAESSYEKENKINTIYSILIDNINIAFLGVLNTPELSNEIKEGLDGIDILFVPTGGGEVLAPEEAHKLSTKLGPSIIIPMDYDDKSLKQFLKEAGSESLKAVDKLTIKKKDVESKEGEIVVLKSL
ncbi:MBL fold metallo-hydrolase [Patescibacteria group bacterium]